MCIITTANFDTLIVSSGVAGLYLYSADHSEYYASGLPRPHLLWPDMTVVSGCLLAAFHRSFTGQTSSLFESTAGLI